MSAPGIADYAEFLPVGRRARVAPEPEAVSWDWNGHDVAVLRRRSPGAPARVVLIHGGGGHARALWPIAAQLPREVVDLTAVDLPLYGSTTSPDPGAVTYRDWVDLLVDFLAAEDDGRPLLLLGASMGGLLSCEVAARSGRVAHVVATCLLNPRDRHSRAVMTRFGPLGVLGGPLARLIRGRARRVRVRIGWVTPLKRMSRNPDLSALCARDPRGGAAAVPLGFLASYLTYRHTSSAMMPVPVTLAHPAEDAWTPVEVSARWLQGASPQTRVVMLRGNGHFPVEEPGLTDFVDAVTGIVGGLGE